MRRRGAILIQLLVGSVTTTIVLGAILSCTLTIYRMQKFSVGMPGVQEDARGIALRLGDALRSATLCTSVDTGCTLDAAVESASATGVTVYRRSTAGVLSEPVYSVTNGNFQMVLGSTTTTFCSGATVALTYYGSSTYYSSSLTPFTPTSTTTKTIAAVGIVATVTRDGMTGRYETMIRLRNSPKP